MPNWCYNEFQVSGPKEDIAKFKLQAVGHNPWEKPAQDEAPSPLNFHSLLPIPAKVLKSDYSNAGHDWEVKHWGCRWGAGDVEVMDETEDSLHYRFDTAWDPPTNFIKHVRKLWPTLTFLLDYDESGEGFKGICKGHGQHYENHRVQY